MKWFNICKNIIPIIKTLCTLKLSQTQKFYASVIVQYQFWNTPENSIKALLFER